MRKIIKITIISGIIFLFCFSLRIEAVTISTNQLPVDCRWNDFLGGCILTSNPGTQCVGGACDEGEVTS